MTDYYGVGTWWGSSRPHQKFNEFINDEKACIHASLDKETQREISNRQRFRNIFKAITIGNIVYLKGYNIPERKIRIRAVGEVKSKNDPTNDDVFCVKINYNHNHDIKGLIDFDDFDDDVKRNTRVYQETNPKVIRIITELMHE